MAKNKKKSFLKRLLKWTGILILLLLILAIVLPYIFKDEIIQFIENEAEKSLRAELELGEVDLSFISTFPDFVLETKNTSLVGVEEFAGVTLFGTKSMEVALDLNSVLFGDSYEIKSIQLVEPEINVLVTKDGIANYDIYITDSTAGPEATEEEEPAPFQLALKQYGLENARIVYSDSTMAFDLILDSLNHTGNGDFTMDELILETITNSSSVTMGYDGVAYLDKVKADIDCNIKMNLSTMRFEFQDNNARLNELELGFNGWFEMTEDYYDMDIKFASKDSKFRSLLSMVPGVYSPDFGAMKTDGVIGFSGKLFDKYSEESMPGFELDLAVENAYFQYPDLPGKVSNINVLANINRVAGPDLDNLVVSVTNAHAEYADNFVDANLLLSRPMSDPNIKLNLGSYLDLGGLSSVIPMEEGETYAGIIESDLHFKGVMSSIVEERYDDFEASGKAVMKGINYTSASLPYDVNIATAEMQFDPQNITLESFESKIGESDIAATGTMDNYLKYAFNEEDLHGKFIVTSNYLNLDELMDVGTADGVPAEPSPEEDPEEAPMEVIPLPENVNFNMETTVNEVLYDSLSIKQVAGNVNLTHSVATLENLRMELLGGTLSLTGTYNTIDPVQPKVAMGLDIDHFDIRETAKYFNTVERLAPIANKCTGFFSSKMNFNSQLDQYWMPVYSTIFGDGNLLTKKVFIEGFEPLNKLAKAVKVDRLSKQTIQDVKCFFKIIDGKIHVEPFDVKLGKIATSVAGSTSFEQDLDYVLAMDIPRSEMGAQANAFVDGLLSQASANGVDMDLGDMIPINVKITGKVTDPKITTDLKEQGKNIMDDIKDQIKDQVTDQINDQLDNVDQQLQAKVEEIMNKARERADQVRAEGKKRADQIREEGKSLAEKTRKEGEAQAQKLIDEAGNNPLKKIAAEKAADALRQETEKSAQKIESEANEKADAVESESNNQADKIIAEAQAEADKIKVDKRVGE